MSIRPLLICLTCLVLAAPAVAQQGPAPIEPIEIPRAPDMPTVDGPEGQDTQPVSGLPSLDQVAQAMENASDGADGEQTEWSSPIRLAMVFAALALLPSLLVMMTSFTRIIIVLSFVRRALTTQNIPPTIALIGLALFLTLFTMAPTFGVINAQALQPYLAEEITFQDACSRGNQILKTFMLSQTREADLTLFVDMAKIPLPETAEQVPSYVAIPAFAISEFRTAFEMGCLLFIPFLLIDLVTAGILLATGMMMLPPSMISMPFKIILFVLVDGWRLLAETLVISFQGVG
ncbi:MAG: flagellar type III secretion system pore protein FliP [Phycisphaerae bacterium]